MLPTYRRKAVTLADSGGVYARNSRTDGAMVVIGDRTAIRGTNDLARDVTDAVDRRPRSPFEELGVGASGVRATASS
jgi:hypothetical protein